MNRENSARFNHLWDRIHQISDSELNIRFEPDGRSISHHLQLVIAEYERWLDYLKGDVDALFFEHELTDNLTKDEVHRYWTSAQQAFANFYYRQSEEELNRTLLEINGPVWEALVHLLLRAEEHYNYILTILASLGQTAGHQPQNRDLNVSKQLSAPVSEPIQTPAH